MFDDPYEIDCCACGADLDESCVDALGNHVPFHVERKNSIVLWNRFFKTGDFDIAPQARNGGDA